MPQVADDLYRLPPAEFTAARDAAVAAARERGDRPEAKALAALKRPTVGAWLVNGLALNRPELVTELIDLGEQLRSAQGSVPAQQLRDLSAARRKLIDAALAVCRSLAIEAGTTPTAAQLQEAQETLAAAMADEEAAGLVRIGRVVKALSYAGFGGGLGAAVPVSSAKRPTVRAQPAEAEPAQPPGEVVEQEEVSAQAASVPAMTEEIEEPAGEPAQETTVSAAMPWEPPIAGDEIGHLLGMLERLRTTFRWKADGLDKTGLNIRIGRSDLTLGNLLKHLAFVEDYTFTTKLRGGPPGEPWQTLHDRSEGWEFRTAGQDSPEQLYSFWDNAVIRTRARIAQALGEGGLDMRADISNTEGEHASLRRLICDLIEEYGRHTGHADLLREAVDGLVGEDPPPGWYPISGQGVVGAARRTG